MLSFEISAMDIVLLVVMTVLVLLFISHRKSRSVAEPRLNIASQERFLGESKNIEETATEYSIKKQSAEGFQKCVYQFGYLRSMPKNSPIPDECSGCPKVMRCLFQNVQAPQIK